MGIAVDTARQEVIKEDGETRKVKGRHSWKDNGTGRKRQQELKAKSRQFFKCIFTPK